LLALHGEQQDEALRAVVAGGLSVRQTERLVRRMAARPRRARAMPSDPVVDALTERLRRALGAPVRARRHAGGLSVLIHFHAPEAAYQLVEALGRGEESDDV
jgi:ParB family chromosome partitioning protein